MIVISILVWDSPEYTANLLRSLFETHRIGAAPHRVYVLDQGSAAPTKAVLAQYADRVRLITLERNVGFPAGHNLVYRTAAAEQSFDFVCLLNSDVVFEADDWLDRLVGAMAEDERVAVAGPWGVCVIDDGPKAGRGRAATEAEMLAGQFDLISGALCAVRARVADQLGLFDEVFTPAYYEDADLNLRYKAAGYRLAHCPVPARHYYRGQTDRSKGEKRRLLVAEYGDFMARNRGLFLSRWGASGFLRNPAEDLA